MMLFVNSVAPDRAREIACCHLGYGDLGRTQMGLKEPMVHNGHQFGIQSAIGADRVRPSGGHLDQCLSLTGRKGYRIGNINAMPIWREREFAGFVPRWNAKLCRLAE
jgi:hypothetical protein